MRVFFIAIFCLTFNFCNSQNLNCENFKTGTFKIEVLNPELQVLELPKSVIIRDRKSQKESAVGHEDMEGDITWTSSCSYELVYVKATPELVGKKINAEIYRVDGDKAYVKSVFEEMPDFILEFVLIKIK